MVSEKSLKIIVSMVRTGTILGCLPFTFHKKSMKLYLLKPEQRKVYYCINAVVLCQTFVLIIQYFVAKASPKGASFLHFFRVLCNAGGGVLQLNVMLNQDTVCLFFNEVFTFIYDSGKPFNPYNRFKIFGNESKDLDFGLNLLQKFSFIYSLIVPLGMIRNPDSPRFTYSLFYKTNKNKGFMVVFYVVDFFYSLFTWHTILINIYFFLIYVYVMREMLLKLSADAKKAVWATSSTTTSLATCYQGLRILNNSFTDSMSPIILPTLKLTCILIPITLNFMSIREYAVMPIYYVFIILIFAIISMIFTITSWPTAATVNSASMKFIRLCPANKRTKKSLRPLHVTFGTFYRLTRFTSAKVFGFVVYWTMKSLLVF